MPELSILKVKLPTDVLKSMPAERSAALLRVGIFVNELNWLVRLLLIARIPNDSSEHERRATIALALMIVKLLAGKMHEGWIKLKKEIYPLVEQSLTAEGRKVAAELANHLAPGSLVHRLRNEHAFHYSTKLSVDDLEGLPLSEEEMVVYMSQHHGHNLFYISELAAIRSLTAITGESDAGRSFQVVMQEVVKIAGLYSDFAVGVLIALLGDDVIDKLESEELPNHAQGLPSMGRVMFFELPPQD